MEEQSELPRPALATSSKSTVFKAFGRPLCFFSVLTDVTLENDVTFSFSKYIVFFLFNYRILFVALILLRKK